MHYVICLHNFIVKCLQEVIYIWSLSPSFSSLFEFCSFLAHYDLASALTLWECFHQSHQWPPNCQLSNFSLVLLDLSTPYDTADQPSFVTLSSLDLFLILLFACELFQFLTPLLDPQYLFSSFLSLQYMCFSYTCSGCFKTTITNWLKTCFCSSKCFLTNCEFSANLLSVDFTYKFRLLAWLRST